MGTRVSFAIGLPLGLMFILRFGPTDVSRDFTVDLFSLFYCRPIIPIIISFIAGLYLAGEKIVIHLADYGYSLLMTSFFFSLYLNGIVWATYILAMGSPFFYLDDPMETLAPPVFWFTFCVALTTFTAGYFICQITQDKMYRVPKAPPTQKTKPQDFD